MKNVIAKILEAPIAQNIGALFLGYYMERKTL